MSALDMALGDVISSRNKEAPKPRPKAAAKGAKGGGNTKGGKGAAKAAKTARAPAPYKARADIAVRKPSGGSLASRLGGKATGERAATSSGTKVLVGNLASDITTADVKELFETVGEVISGRVFGKSGNAEVVFAQQSKALEAIKQFNNRTLDGIPMDVKLAPRAGVAEKAVPQPQGKAALFGSALGGQGRNAAAVQPSFSVVLPKFEGACNNCGKAGHKASECRSAGKAAKFEGACNNCGKAGHKASECRSAPKVAGKTEPKAPKGKKEPKAAPASSEDLDGEMDAYFAARNAPAADAPALE